MSKKLFYIIGIFFTIVIGTYMYCYLCDSCNCSSFNKVTEEENSVLTPEIKATLIPFSVNDAEGDFAFKIQENLNFKKSNFIIIEPISNDVNAKILELKNYLSANPLKSLEIKGYFTSVEKNNSAFPDLGMARANVVKNYLVSTGVSSKQINISGKINEDLLADGNGVYYGPLFYEISTQLDENSSTDTSIVELRESLIANPIKLYFEMEGFTINLTSEQRQKIANMSRYIDKVEDAIIQVIGHTDNTGGKYTNLKLGQDRADFVKRYLVGNAIPEGRIDAISKGSGNPTADNSTEEGRLKNRYVLITIN